MAFSFNGSNQGIIAAGAPVSGEPMTFANSFFVNNVTNGHAFVSVIEPSSTGAYQYFGLNAAGAVASDPIVAAKGTTDGTWKESAAKTTLNFSSAVWSHAVATFTSTTERSVFLNGANKGSDTISIQTKTYSKINIGFTISDNGTIFNPTNGYLAEIAIWNVALTDAEIASLAKGFKPTRIRPQSLVFYAPLLRNLQDLRGGLALTNNNGATVADHPRVY